MRKYVSIFLDFLSIWAPLQSEIYETYMELQYHANLTTSFFIMLIYDYKFQNLWPFVLGIEM